MQKKVIGTLWVAGLYFLIVGIATKKIGLIIEAILPIALAVFLKWLYTEDREDSKEKKTESKNENKQVEPVRKAEPKGNEASSVRIHQNRNNSNVYQDTAVQADEALPTYFPANENDPCRNERSLGIRVEKDGYTVVFEETFPAGGGRSDSYELPSGFFWDKTQLEIEEILQIGASYIEPEYIKLSSEVYRRLVQIDKLYITQKLYKDPSRESAEVLKALSPRVIDKCYGSSGYGMGLERNMTVLFFAESVGYFCVQQSSSNAGDAYRYKILQPADSKPRVEDHVNDEGYSCWFANAWFADWIRAEFKM